MNDDWLQQWLDEFDKAMADFSRRMNERHGDLVDATVFAFAAMAGQQEPERIVFVRPDGSIVIDLVALVNWGNETFDGIEEVERWLRSGEDEWSAV